MVLNKRSAQTFLFWNKLWQNFYQIVLVFLREICGQRRFPLHILARAQRQVRVNRKYQLFPLFLSLMPFTHYRSLLPTCSCLALCFQLQWLIADSFCVILHTLLALLVVLIHSFISIHTSNPTITRFHPFVLVRLLVMALYCPNMQCLLHEEFLVFGSMHNPGMHCSIQWDNHFKVDA